MFADAGYSLWSCKIEIGSIHSKFTFGAFCLFELCEKCESANVCVLDWLIYKRLAVRAFYWTKQTKLICHVKLCRSEFNAKSSNKNSIQQQTQFKNIFDDRASPASAATS